MNLLTQKPALNLQKLVCRYTSLKVSSREIEQIYPSGSYRLPSSLIRIAFHFTEDIPWIEASQKKIFQPQVNIRGFQLQPLSFISRDPLDVFTTEFTPFGFYHLFGISCKDLTEFPLPLEAVLGKEYPFLSDKLNLAGTFSERVRFMNEYLLSKRKVVPALDQAFHIENLIDKSPCISDVNTLSGETFITKRTLQRLFDRHFGMSPKTYIRLKRVERCFQSLIQTPEEGLNDIALNLGFYDQAHFTNELREYIDMTPAQFRKKFFKQGPKKI